MNKLGLSLALLALLALSGCASTKDFVTNHPVVTAIAVSCVALSVPSLFKGRSSHSGEDHTVTTLPVDCRGGACQ